MKARNKYEYCDKTFSGTQDEAEWQIR